LIASCLYILRSWGKLCCILVPEKISTFHPEGKSIQFLFYESWLTSEQKEARPSEQRSSRISQRVRKWKRERKSDTFYLMQVSDGMSLPGDPEHICFTENAWMEETLSKIISKARLNIPLFLIRKYVQSPCFSHIERVMGGLKIFLSFSSLLISIRLLCQMIYSLFSDDISILRSRFIWIPSVSHSPSFRSFLQISPSSDFSFEDFLPYLSHLSSTIRFFLSPPLFHSDND
jgi:hypothetical protein